MPHAPSRNSQFSIPGRPETNSEFGIRNCRRGEARTNSQFSILNFELSARELGVLIGAVCPRLGALASRVNGCSGVGVVGWAPKRSF